MALTASTIGEVWSTGSDSVNAGLFDPSQTAGMFTDGAATSANTSAPVFTSASYNFVAGDAGAFVYIASGTNWTPGWYYITSVAANAATLNGTIGQATLKALTLSTVVGCATTASPTSATWTIDYSQQAAAQFAYTDLASAGTGLTVSSAGKPFAKQQVGNGLVITGGTNFNTGRYIIASISGTTATVVGPTNITTGAGASGTGGLGGAVATVQQGLTNLTILGNVCFVKNTATYVIGTGLTVPSGSSGFTAINRVIGYGSYPGDGTRAIIQANAGITMLTLSQQGWNFENFEIDGNSVASTNGVNITGNYCGLFNCKVRRMAGYGVQASIAYLRVSQCEITVCGTTAGASLGTSQGMFSDNWVHDCTVPGVTAGSGGVMCISGNRITNNSGASSDGIQIGFGNWAVFNTIYNSGRDGIRLTTNDVSIHPEIANNILYLNGGYGINCTSAPSGIALQAYTNFHHNAYLSNTSGAVNNLGQSATSVTLTVDPFTAKASDDYTLNSAVGGGLSCRAAGSRTGLDIGALQHIDGPIGRPVLIQSGSSSIY